MLRPGDGPVRQGDGLGGGQFDSYLGSHTLGNSATPTLGYALQTGANQSKDLPWININVIEATFSEAVNVSQSSLVLTGGSQSGYSTPSVTGFSSLGGNTYAWTLSTSLTKNRLEISFLSTGAHAVTDTLAGRACRATGPTAPAASPRGMAWPARPAAPTPPRAATSTSCSMPCLVTRLVTAARSTRPTTSMSRIR